MSAPNWVSVGTSSFLMAPAAIKYGTDEWGVAGEVHRRNVYDSQGFWAYLTGGPNGRKALGRFQSPEAAQNAVKAAWEALGNEFAA